MFTLLLQVFLPFANLEIPEFPIRQPIVAIDAGHGALNPGTRYRFRHEGRYRLFVEKAYTCDIAARTMQILKDSAVAVRSTTRGPCLETPDSGDLLDATVIDRNMRFLSNDKVVSGTKEGLRERIRSAANLGTSWIDTLVVSIHVDSAHSSEIEGAYVIVSPGLRHSPLAWHIVWELGKIKPLRYFCRNDLAPVVEAGKCGIKRVLLLTEPPALKTVLVELGNVGNALERAKFLNPDWRERLAEAIAFGIINHIRHHPAAGT